MSIAPQRSIPGMCGSPLQPTPDSTFVVPVQRLMYFQVGILKEGFIMSVEGHAYVVQDVSKLADQLKAILVAERMS